MVVQDHILVRVVSEGHCLTEHNEPGSPMVPPNTHVRYVEVSTGAKFAIKLQLLPGFDFQAADVLGYEVYIDDSTLNHYGKLLPNEGNPVNDKIRKHITESRAESVFYNSVTNSYESGGFQFGVLSMVEETNDRLTINPEVLQNMGSIRVMVYRAKIEKVAPYFPGQVPLARDEISETILKGKSLKNNVKYVDMKALQSAKLDESYIPIDGPHGKTYKFTFHYRTKRILQTIGVLARTPSPPVDTDLLLARTDAQRQELKLEANDGLFKAQRRIEALTAENEALRHRNSSVLTDSTDTRNTSVTPGTSRNASVKPEPDSIDLTGRPRIKREFKREPIDLTTAPISRPGLVIDLTESSTPPPKNRKRGRPSPSPSATPQYHPLPSKRARYESVALHDDDVMQDSTVQYHVPPGDRKRKRGVDEGNNDGDTGRSAKRPAVDLTDD